MDFDKRWKAHTNHLKRQTHPNKKIQFAWQKYQEQAFTFEIIELVEDSALLLKREQHYLDTLKPHFNIAPVAGSTLGIPRSPECRALIAAKAKGRIISDQHKAAISAKLKGKAQSKELVEKRMASRRGRPFTEQALLNMAEARRHRPSLKGIKKSAEHCQKLSDASKNRFLNLDDEARKKLSQAAQILWEDPQFRAKCSLAMKKENVNSEFVNRPCSECGAQVHRKSYLFRKGQPQYCSERCCSHAEYKRKKNKEFLKLVQAADPDDEL